MYIPEEQLLNKIVKIANSKKMNQSKFFANSLNNKSWSNNSIFVKIWTIKKKNNLEKGKKNMPKIYNRVK